MSTAKRERPDSKYLDTFYKNGEIRERVISHREMLDIKSEESDFYWNEPERRAVIKRRKGPPLEYVCAIPGIHQVGWMFTTELMYAPGEFLSTHELHRRTKHESFLSRANVSSHLKRIRRVFGESGKEPWYFWTTRTPEFGVCWRRDRTWRIIERLAEPSEPTKDRETPSEH